MNVLWQKKKPRVLGVIAGRTIVFQNDRVQPYIVIVQYSK